MMPAFALATGASPDRHMFDKFKNAVADNAIRSAIEKYSGRITEKLPEIAHLPPLDVRDDARFHTTVIAPALAKVVAASSGATRLIPDFDQRFSRAMLYLRDQLVRIDEPAGKVSLVPGYEARVSDVLVEGFKLKN
jgi:hypothetical protein